MRHPLLLSLLSLLLSAPLLAQTPQARVHRLELRGNDFFSDRQLHRIMTSSPRWYGKKRYHEGTLNSDINAVLAAYEAQGFLDARVTERQIDISEDGRSVDVRIHLAEGPRTHITGVTVRGAARVPEAELRDIMKSRPGAPFRRQQLLADRGRLEATYAERGMIATRIGYEAVVDSAGSVRVEYLIDEGAPVRVDSVSLEGLDKTHPDVVRRELKLQPGDLIRRSLLAQTQTAIFSTGLFRSVTVSPAPGVPTDTLRVVVVRVRERLAGNLDLGVGYGSSERFRAGVKLAQTNWLGRGLRVGANARASRLLRTGEGVFTVPFLFGHRVALDGRMFHEWERNPEAGFRTQTTGTEETFSYQWRNRWVTDVSYSLRRIRLRFDEAGLYQPARTTSSVSLGMRRDSRDNPIDSRAGTMIRVRADLAGGVLGGDGQFYRSTVELLHFRPVWFAVAGVHAVAGGIDAASESGRVDTYDQFFLGGDRSVRGYGRGEIGADRIGELAFNMQLELRLPVWRHGLVLFHDAGQVWTGATDVDIPGDLRRANGAGLRINTRFGLLRVDLAIADKSGSFGDRLGFYLGVGQAF